jgi:hypothetical protein
VWSCRLWGPLFRRDTAAIDKAFIPAPLLLVMQLGQEGSPECEQEARLLPGFAPAPAGAGTPIAPREFAPLGPRPQDPEEALTAAPSIHTWASTSGGNLGLGEMDADGFPLLLGQFSPRQRLPSHIARPLMALSYSNP